MRTATTVLSLSLLIQVSTGFVPTLGVQSRISRWPLHAEQSDEAKATSSSEPAPKLQPDILLPFPPAADASYMCTGPVGQKDFCVTRTGPPILETELTNENILKIVKTQCTDLEVNTLVWKCFGYRFNPEESSWGATECFPKWREKYPEPPDFIGTLLHAETSFLSVREAAHTNIMLHGLDGMSFLWLNRCDDTHIASSL